jgi:hypothetical protein
MTSAWAGHESPSFTPWKNVGSLQYRRSACPDLATRPAHFPFQGTNPAKASSFFPPSQPLPASNTHRPDDEGSKHLWNVSKLLPDYTAQHPRRQPAIFILAAVRTCSLYLDPLRILTTCFLKRRPWSWKKPLSTILPNQNLWEFVSPILAICPTDLYVRHVTTTTVQLYSITGYF